MCYTNRQYRNRLDKLEALQAQVDALEAQIDAIKDDIKADMGDREAVEGEGFTIRWTRYVSNRFDSKAFKQDHSKLYSAYVVPQETRRFTWEVR